MLKKERHNIIIELLEEESLLNIVKIRLEMKLNF